VKNNVTVYTDGQRLKMTFEEAVKNIIMPALDPRRCVICDAPLEYYGELDGVEDWHPLIATTTDYLRCDECAEAHILAETEVWQ